MKGKEKREREKKACVFSQLLLAVSKRYGRRLDPTLLPEARLDLLYHLRKKNHESTSLLSAQGLLAHVPQNKSRSGLKKIKKADLLFFSRKADLVNKMFRKADLVSVVEHKPGLRSFVIGEDP